MSAFKKGLLFIHRWLGFISGLVVFIVSITGCLFCFQDELQDALHDYRHVTASNQPYLKPSVLEKIVANQFPAGKVSGIAINTPNRAAQVGMVDKEGYHNIYINPYTGKILGNDLLPSNFFVIVEYIHLYLLLPANIGRVVVGTSTLIFMVLMITGIILWWPKRKTDRKRSFTIKWNGRWRRVNYDLHNVLGFYATAIAIVIALTGVSMSFEWVRNGIYKAGNLGKEIASERKIFKSDSVNKAVNPAGAAVDVAYQTIKKYSPNAQMVLFYGNDKPGDALYGVAYPQVLHYRSNDAYQFDQYSGKLLNYLPNAKKSLGLKLENANYDIHVGQIGGFFGKVVAFLASLISASSPITGFIIWLGKRKKTKKATAGRRVAHQHSQRRVQMAAAKVK